MPKILWFQLLKFHLCICKISILGFCCRLNKQAHYLTENELADLWDIMNYADFNVPPEVCHLYLEEKKVSWMGIN